MFWLGLFLGVLCGWFFTRLYYSSHAKKEAKDTASKIADGIKDGASDLIDKIKD